MKVYLSILAIILTQLGVYLLISVFEKNIFWIFEPITPVIKLVLAGFEVFALPLSIYLIIDIIKDIKRFEGDKL